MNLILTSLPIPLKYPCTLFEPGIESFSKPEKTPKYQLVTKWIRPYEMLLNTHSPVKLARIKTSVDSPHLNKTHSSRYWARWEKNNLVFWAVRGSLAAVSNKASYQISNNDFFSSSFFLTAQMTASSWQENTLFKLSQNMATWQNLSDFYICHMLPKIFHGQYFPSVVPIVHFDIVPEPETSHNVAPTNLTF